jgi:hypothetical protein
MIASCTNSVEEITLETYEMSKIRLGEFPYANQSVVFFEDITGKIIEFDITESKIDIQKHSNSAKPYNSENGKLYRWSTEVIEFLLKNDSEKIEFRIQISYTPCNIKEGILTPTEFMFIVLRLDEGTEYLPRTDRSIMEFVPENNKCKESEGVELIDSLDIKGNKYYNLAGTKHNTEYQIVYSNEFGIISFLDKNKKTWIFKKFGIE